MNGLPEHMQASAQAYIEHGQPPGGFLRAVLENDLVDAFELADSENECSMRAWVAWLYRDVPPAAWKSQQAVNDWIKQGGLVGIAERYEAQFRTSAPAATPKAAR